MNTVNIFTVEIKNRHKILSESGGDITYTPLSSEEAAKKAEADLLLKKSRLGYEKAVGTPVQLRKGNEAKKKWKNLKDKYRKISQKPTPKSGSAAVPAKQKWRFFELMRITRDVLVPTATIGNYTATTPPSVNDDIQEASGYDHIESQNNFDAITHETLLSLNFHNNRQVIK
ncbi:hypothetical protein JTB14_004881 [Gonioctena quinquepunctata]|nr:hypothetical protein JTB14_004881 [Gonioctena quinquepunctata]